MFLQDRSGKIANLTQKWRKLPAWMLPLLVAFVFLPTVAGLFGRSFWLFELATHFRPQLLLGAAFFALVAVISRRPGILLTAMLAGAVNAVPLLAYATASVARGAPEHRGGGG